MNCGKAIRELPAYLDHELSRPEVTELERHLEVCVFCSTELAALRSTSKMMDAWREVSPRRGYVDGVIEQIRAEEQGASERSGVRTRLLQRRWAPGAVRSAAVVVFVIGVTLFSGHDHADRRGSDRMNRIGNVRSILLSSQNKHGTEPTDRSPGPAIAFIPLNEDLAPSYIRPSERGLLWRGIENRGRLIVTNSGDLATRWTRDAHPFSGSLRFPEVNHIYFPGEGMPVESVIPLELP